MTRVFVELRNTSKFPDPICLFYDPERSLNTHVCRKIAHCVLM